MHITPYLSPIEAARRAYEGPSDDDEPSTTELTEALIRSLLVRPGSDVNGLLRDALAGKEWLDGIDALVRRAAGLQTSADIARIGVEFCRVVSVAIAEAAAERTRKGVA